MAIVDGIQERINTAREIKQSLDKLIADAKIHDLGESRVAASFYLTIAEQFLAVLHLIEGGFSSHAPTLIRSMLEAWANLILLTNDSRYLDQLRFENARNDAILFEEYAALMQSDPDAVALLNDWGQQARPVRDHLKARGLKKQNIDEKFKLAGIQETYVTYRTLCSFSHNQLSTMLGRHARNNMLLYHAPAPEETIIGMLNLALSIMFQAFNRFPLVSSVLPQDVKSTLEAADHAWLKFQAKRHDDRSEQR